MTLFDSIRRLRAAHDLLLAEPASSTREDAFKAARQSAAETAVQIPHRDLNDPAVADAWDLALSLAQQPASELGTPNEILTASAKLSGPVSGKALARALTGRAWEYETITRFDELPDGIWTAYARWVFARPPYSADATHFAAHAARAAEELATWAERNLGSQSVRAAIEVFLQTGSLPLGAWPANDRTRWQTARGRILNRWHKLPRISRADVIAPLPQNRRIRVGMVGVATDTALDAFVRDATVALVPNEKLELIPFHDSAVIGRDGETLPPDLMGKCRALSEQGLDVVVFAPDTSGWDDALASLAAVRHADLQIAIGDLTTGLPAIDLILTPATAPPGCTERVAATPFPSLCNPLAFDQTVKDPAIRTSLALPTDAVVIATPSDPLAIDSTARDAICRAMAQQPQLHLVLPSETAQMRWHLSLRVHDVATDRLIFLPQTDDARRRTELVSIADIWLDFDPSADLSLLAIAATHQMPLLTWSPSGTPISRTARTLHHIGQDSSLVCKGPELTEKLTALAADPAQRQSEGQRLHHSVFDSQKLPDSLAVADVLAEVIEAGHQRLVELGRPRFARDTKPLLAPASAIDAAELLVSGEAALQRGDADDACKLARQALRGKPQYADARLLLGRALSALGHHQPAIAYLTAAVSGHEHDSGRWLELARAFRAAAEMPSALDALGACLQVAPDCLDGWIMMVELAEGAGATEIAHESLEAAQRLAPEDPRVQKLAQANEALSPDAEVATDPFAAFAPPAR
jgi:protein O-GlcNAc transferase